MIPKNQTTPHTVKIQDRRTRRVAAVHRLDCLAARCSQHLPAGNQQSPGATTPSKPPDATHHSIGPFPNQWTDAHQRARQRPCGGH
jgi:hypothetical protein